MNKKERKWVDYSVVTLCLLIGGGAISFLLYCAFQQKNITVQNSPWTEDAVCTTPIMLWEYIPKATFKTLTEVEKVQGFDMGAVQVAMDGRDKMYIMVIPYREIPIGDIVNLYIAHQQYAQSPKTEFVFTR